ncbi:hypothetical protein BDP27DRAFT_1324666 [Rhodocollybia butyracea]|uniref:Uncharacterized protein n=1 Tax=Rhodocollybia butyracea TaxID=206335 RepID=A0A9P5U8E3_9AGAR|nr:hypothetical protein BDP27DRAFT_1324666 [Rhodocollybia butyracea]
MVTSMHTYSLSVGFLRCVSLYLLTSLDTQDLNNITANQLLLIQIMGGAESGSRSGETATDSPEGPGQQYLLFSNPFQDPGLLRSMSTQWQQLPSWKAANIEGQSWEGTSEENIQRYKATVGISDTS